MGNSYHKIYYETLRDIVLERIRDDKKKLEQAKKHFAELDVIISRLYEDFVLGELSKDRYKKCTQTMKPSRNG